MDNAGDGQPQVRIFCEYGPDHGLGHVMRCLALAQALVRAGAEVTFFTHSRQAAVQELLSGHGMSVEKLPESGRGLDFDPPVKENILTIFDHYGATEEQMLAYRRAGTRLAAIDDLADRRFSCEAVLNQNLGAGDLVYRVESGTKVLLGPRYALLRETILGVKRDPQERCVLITFGGAHLPDKVEAVLRRIAALDRRLKKPLRLLLATTSAQLPVVEALFQGLRHIEIEVFVDRLDLAPALRRCAFALTAAGSTVLELACLGVPQIALGLSPNQEVNGLKITAAGIGVYLGEAASLQVGALEEAFLSFLRGGKTLARMSERGRELVDGQGASRAAAELLKLLPAGRQPLQISSQP